ncbi:MAG: protein translocase subunit SecF [Halobacteriaceae archaeon]
MVSVEVPEVDYERYTNRQLLAVPLAVLAVALLVLVAWYLLYGSPVQLGIEFTGGTELTVVAPGGADQIRSTFASGGPDDPCPCEIASIRSVQALGGGANAGDTYIVTFQAPGSGTTGDDIAAHARKEGLTVTAVRTTSATFGEDAQSTAVLGLVLAFIGMSVVVFVLFRTLIPSVAVVVSAFSDIVIPLALMDLFGIRLSLGTVAALLMLIGYSVDSDILLNNHVLRRSGGFYESVHRAMQTGVTMTVTSIAAMTVMTITAYIFGVDLLASIGLVLVMGLTADLMNTYMLNLSLLRWYTGASA